MTDTGWYHCILTSSMKNYLLTCLLTLGRFTLVGQSKDSWTSFWNKDSSLLGFKDKNGVVTLKPAFNGLTIADKFDDIIAVTEEKDDRWNNYYLTKTGRIVGKDSLYIFDNGADCESEGFIRFRDPITDKTGMFNRNGDIVIPAVYNALTNVRNGMVVALKGAQKIQSGEHFSWKGGREILIDTSNNMLVDSFIHNHDLNFFSLIVSAKPNQATIRQHFKTVNGQYYSFIDFNKEFSAWLKASLLSHLTKENLLRSSYKEISYWKEPTGWTTEPRHRFINRNFNLIKTKLSQLHSKDCDYAVFDEGLNPYIYAADEYRDFFNNCREARDWLYPVKNIVITYKNNKRIITRSF